MISWAKRPAKKAFRTGVVRPVQTRVSRSGERIERNTADYVAAAKQRMDALPDAIKAVGVIRLWPDQAVAEHENVERLRSAAALVGVDIVELDRHGRVLASPGSTVTSTDVEFVLHLHFETPKTYDVLSFGAMWNPLSFYFDWGFDTYWPNQMSHDLFAWTGAESIRDMIAMERGPAFADRMPLLNHTLAEPIYQPRHHDELQLFYCGINWEKLGGKPGRHDGVLRELDKMGRLALYGPEEIRGIKVWDGYQGYRGSLPFDGRTVIENISDAGACLVFSSDAHKASGIMSNRLFEAMAGGAVVIGDEHPFIPEAIGDNFIKVPASWTTEERVEAIGDALSDLEANPQRARQMATNAQNALLERFFLSEQLVGLFEAAHAAKAERAKALEVRASVDLDEPLVDVVVQPLGVAGDLIRGRLEELHAALGGRANIIVVSSAEHAEWFERKLAGIASVAARAEDDGAEKHILTPIELLRAARPHLRAAKVWFPMLIEEIYPEQFLLALQAFSGRAVGRLGHLLQHYDNNGAMHLDYQSGDRDAGRLHPAALSSCIFDRRWLLEKVRIPMLTWRQCLEAAEVEEQGVAFDQPTSVIINIKAYERVLQSGYGEAAGLGGSAFANRIGTRRSILSDGAIATHYVLPAARYDVVKGQTIAFTSDTSGDYAAMLGTGWSSPESTHLWSVGPRSTLMIRAPRTVKEVAIEMTGNPHVTGGEQQVTLIVNDASLGEFDLAGASHVLAQVDCTRSPWVAGELNEVVIKPSETATPPKASGDPRDLGVCLWKISAS